MGILLKRLAQQIEGRPAKLFFVSETGVETARTFAQLHEDILALTARLRKIGVRPGQRIGLYGPSSYAWLAWDLACIELGCVTVAFAQEKVGQPVEEWTQRYSLSLLAVDPTWVNAATLALGHVMQLDVGEFPAAKSALGGAVAGDPPGVHSLVFSSGTTGKTKGLIISRAGTERLVSLYGEAFGVQAGERFLTFLPFANYQQRMTYYFCLHHGIDFVCVPFELLFASLKKYQPTFTVAPPLFYESVQSVAQYSGKAPGSIDGSATAKRLADLLGGNIRYLITGMAPIKKRTLEFFWENGIPLYEAFGITEAGMVTWNKPGEVKIGTVGKPAESGTVSLTEEGEVIVTRDALLSLGYFEASEQDRLTTFLSEHSVATGDIAAFDAEGFLTIIGRKKDAIITRSGEKFHPEPIEALIQSDARVKSAVVTECDGLSGTAAIISTLHHEDPVITVGIREHITRINGQLPPCQQVRKVLFTEKEFTIANGLRTRNMKLNRNAIRRTFLG
jgi:long-chain acyl-CoA synthetase